MVSWSADVSNGSIATDEVEVTRSRMSASPLKADNLHTISASPLSARTGLVHCRKRLALFDHLVGASEHLSSISLRISSAQSTSGRVCQAFGIVGEEAASVSYSTISVGEIRFQI